MAKCYLMIEDTGEGLRIADASGKEQIDFQFAVDFDCPKDENGHQVLPETVEDMTPAQECTWNFYNVLMSMADPLHKERVKSEVGSKIVVPGG